ncbi:hypothetical protein ACQ3G6_08625 [Allorhizobium undicola]|uniref:hypothetical protein n=1 Tax=Allorhizobium undicola TaxID=78527 RepID=UPI003D32F84A
MVNEALKVFCEKDGMHVQLTGLRRLAHREYSWFVRVRESSACRAFAVGTLLASSPASNRLALQGKGFRSMLLYPLFTWPVSAFRSHAPNGSCIQRRAFYQTHKGRCNSLNLLHNFHLKSIPI